MVSIFIKANLRAENGGLFISRGVGRHPRRVINSWELIFVESGVLSISEENENYTVKAGQSLLLEPGKVHEGTVDFPTGLKFYWIHFTIDQDTHHSFNEESAVKITLPAYVTANDPESILLLLRLFLSEQSANVHGNTRDIILLLILEKLSTYYDKSINSASDSVLVSQVMLFINTHYHLKISTSSIAAKFNCNPDYLGRLFRMHHGMTITDKINMRRVKKSERLLISSLYSLHDIAVQCGFTNVSYFREIFKRQNGMTPRKWRGLYSKIHFNTN